MDALYPLLVGLGIVLVTGAVALLVRRVRRRAQRELESASAAHELALQQERQLRLTQEEEVARQRQKIQEFRRANLSWTRTGEALQQEVTSLREQIQAVRSDLVSLRRHTVFLDGMPGSGKTTFIERLTNPTATPEQLRDQTSTQYRYHTDPIPLCWELVGEQRILHTLEFFDMAGENPEQMVDNILSYRERRLSDQGRALTLVLWDAAADHSRNVGYFNVGRMKAVFGARVARDVISSYVFFFNKCDIVEEQLRRDRSDTTLATRLSLQKQILIAEVFEKSLYGYPPPGFAEGSALTGAGMHTCLGAIVRHLSLDAHFRRPGQALAPDASLSGTALSPEPSRARSVR